MNLKKIGAYIASKRKALGITQVELATQLGMSDKSVSKWERGICLPDVSVYTPLCEILGISINEFIAGEDLDHDRLVYQAEKNILDVASAAKKKYNQMQRVFLTVTVLYFLLITWLSLTQSVVNVNYIDLIDKNSQEMMIAGAVNDGDSIFGYRYSLQTKCKEISFYMTEYEEDKAVSTDCVAKIPDAYNLWNGVMVVTTDVDSNNININMVNRVKSEAIKIHLKETGINIDEVSKISSDISRSNSIRKNERIDLVRMSGKESEHSYLLSVIFE